MKIKNDPISIENVFILLHIPQLHNFLLIEVNYCKSILVSLLCYEKNILLFQELNA
jgi:hypothetical protein